MFAPRNDGRGHGGKGQYDPSCQKRILKKSGKDQSAHAASSFPLVILSHLSLAHGEGALSAKFQKTLVFI
jgi:hypothetical protein